MSLGWRSYKTFKKILNYSSISTYKISLNSQRTSTTVLGIETSCDDTGCAIVNSAGNILGESLYSQNTTHLRCGGVNPVFAHELHRNNIEPAVTEALGSAGITIDDVNAVAVTTKPGLLVSLQVGVKYAKFLSRIHHKPLIPIHHMEAHALVTRMYHHDLQFPFLVLLISGGDCLVAVARDVNDFLLLGKTLDNAPGEIFDKAARRMKLRNIPAYSRVPGGKAIELAARNATNPEMFNFPLPLIRYRDCNFSFSGLKDSLIRKLLKKEEENRIIGDEVIPEVNDLCAAFQLAIAEHITHRIERAVLYCEKNNLIPDHKSIVVSGGVACNDFIFQSIQVIGRKVGYKVYRPPPRVCTDNGVMIAWNGIERFKKQCGVVSNIDLRDIDPEAPFGLSLIDEVRAANLATKVTKINKISVTYLRFFFNPIPFIQNNIFM